MLFITPPALAALAARMSDAAAKAIHGIHYGGMSLAPESVNEFRARLPQRGPPGRLRQHAVRRGHGSGRRAARGDGLLPAGRSRPVSRRGWHDDDSWPPSRSVRVAGCVFHRLDESCLLVGVVERDEAERMPPSPAKPAAGRHAGRSAQSAAAGRTEPDSCSSACISGKEAVMPSRTRLTIAYTPDSDDAFYYDALETGRRRCPASTCSFAADR